MFVDRQEAHGHAIATRPAKLHSELRTLLRKKFMRDLDQNASAIAGLRVRTRSAAMSQVDQHLETLANDLLALLASNAGNQAHAASIMLILWPVQTLGVGNAMTGFR